MKEKQAILHRIGCEDIEGELPPVLDFDRVIEECDLYLTSLGFETRALAIGEIMAKAPFAQRRHAQALMAVYSSNVSDNEANRGELTRQLNSFCAHVSPISGDQPNKLAVELRAALDRLPFSDRPLHVMFDISAASGNLILSLMQVLIEAAEQRHIKLTLAYSEPEDYLPTADEYVNGSEDLVRRACDTGDDTSVHEFGVAEVETNELYPGENIEHRPEYIIAIPALRTERLSRCLQLLTDQPLADPDKFIFWILGVPPASERHFRLEMQKRVITRLLQGMSGHEGEGVRARASLGTHNSALAGTLDYRQVLRVVVEKIDEQAGKNLSVVHMGSKMQAIGVSLALAARSEVNVCYARPARYNASLYSVGIGAAWGVAFEDLGAAVQAVRKVGTLAFQTRLQPERAHSDESTP